MPRVKSTKNKNKIIINKKRGGMKRLVIGVIAV
jgi:hypothetical protein